MARPGEDWATARHGLAANSDDVGKELARLENIEHGLRFVLRNIEAGLAHHFHHERIQGAWFQAGALRCELGATDVVHERFLGRFIVFPRFHLNHVQLEPTREARSIPPDKLIDTPRRRSTRPESARANKSKDSRSALKSTPAPASGLDSSMRLKSARRTSPPVR